MAAALEGKERLKAVADEEISTCEAYGLLIAEGA